MIEQKQQMVHIDCKWIRLVEIATFYNYTHSRSTSACVPRDITKMEFFQGLFMRLKPRQKHKEKSPKTFGVTWNNGKWKADSPILWLINKCEAQQKTEFVVTCMRQTVLRNWMLMFQRPFILFSWMFSQLFSSLLFIIDYVLDHRKVHIKRFPNIS